MIADFKAGEKIEQACLVRLQKIGTSSNGKTYAKGLLEDNSGCVPFICFEMGPIGRLKNAEVPRPYMIGGNVDINKFATDMSLQVIVQKAEVPGASDSIDNLLPSAPIDLNAYKTTLAHFIESLTDAGISKLVRTIFSGETYQQMLINPAGMRLHHAYIGGLLHHTVSVTKIALGMSEAIADVNRDLVLAGALLHDIGKLQEIAPELGFPYTDKGRLLGHISMGAMMLKEAAKKVPELSEDNLNALLHIMLAHHGEREKGSPVLCATKESFIVHYADETDAIMNQYLKMKPQSWEYNKMLQRYLFKSC